MRNGFVDYFRLGFARLKLVEALSTSKTSYSLRQAQAEQLSQTCVQTLLGQMNKVWNCG
jgi:hypothetical protein